MIIWNRVAGANALVIVPLQTALRSRQPAYELIVHSDRGGQYVSTDLLELVNSWRIRPSMSRADDPYDNRTGGPAFAESFWIGPPKRPPKGGSIGRWLLSERERCPYRNF